MVNYKEIEGNLITLAQAGKFDVIAHGVNCFCTMGAGLAPQMAKAFGCDKFPMEAEQYNGDINKLGTIDYQHLRVSSDKYVNEINAEGKDKDMTPLIVVNAYTQYGFGSNHSNGTSHPLDYSALSLVFKKMDHLFRDMRIGLPLIGCGLAGGSEEVVKQMIKVIFTKAKSVTIVNYKP